MTPAILYLEDEDSDAFFMRLAFKNVEPPVDLRIVDDGEKALAYLQGQPPYDDRSRFPVPGLILLDLNVPILSGFEVLAWVRKQPQFDRTPVVIFSSSGRPEDKKLAKDLGADDYFTKPDSGMQFQEVVQSLLQSLSKDVLNPPS